jgi:hypothetical protein
MQAFCQRCRQPRHIVGGRAVVRSENRIPNGGGMFVELVRHVVEGRCETCGSALNRLNPKYQAKPRREVETTALSLLDGEVLVVLPG